MATTPYKNPVGVKKAVERAASMAKQNAAKTNSGGPKYLPEMAMPAAKAPNWNSKPVAAPKVVGDFGGKPIYENWAETTKPPAPTKPPEPGNFQEAMATYSGQINPPTQDDINAQANKSYADQGDMADKYDLWGVPKSQQQLVDEKKRRDGYAMESFNKQNDLANTIEGNQLKDAEEGALSNISGVKSNLQQGREGVMSEGNTQAVGEYTSTITRGLETTRAQFQQAQLRRDDIRQQMLDAQSSSNTGLAQQLSGELAQAESTLRQAYQDTLNLQNQAAQISNDTRRVDIQAQANTRANVQAMDSIIQSGVEMNTTALLNMSKQLDVPFEMVNSYYEGAKFIRDDKKMTADQKQVALDQLKFTFEQKKQGLDSEAAEKIKGLQTLTQQGATPEQIKMYKQAAGIKDQDDPMYMMDQQLKSLEIQMAQNAMNGIPNSIDDQVKLIDLYQKRSEYNGTYTDGYLPAKSKNGVMASYQNGQYNVVTPPGYLAQCGRFVNDVFGTAIFGDSYNTSKKPLIDKYGFTVAGKSKEELMTMVKPGMAFVMPVTKKDGTNTPYGHVGIVKSVNPDGTITTIEANWGNNEKVTSQIKNMSQIYGFMPPPNANLQGGGGGSGSAIDINNVLSVLPLQIRNSEAERKEYTDIAKKLLSSGMSLADAKNEIVGFRINKDSDKPFASALRDLSANTDIVEKGKLPELANLINNGQMGQAITMVENAKLQQADKGLKNTAEAQAVVSDVEHIRKLSKEVPAGQIGKYDRALNKFQSNLPWWASDAERKKANEFAAALTGLNVKIRHAIAGSAVTENESKYLNDLLSSLEDQPETIGVKIDEIQREALHLHNAARRTVALPEVNVEQLLNAESRRGMYNELGQKSLNYASNAPQEADPYESYMKGKSELDKIISSFLPRYSK